MEPPSDAVTPSWASGKEAGPMLGAIPNCFTMGRRAGDLPLGSSVPLECGIPEGFFLELQVRDPTIPDSRGSTQGPLYPDSRGGNPGTTALLLVL